jgi:hypothetical protein
MKAKNYWLMVKDLNGSIAEYMMIQKNTQSIIKTVDNPTEALQNGSLHL